MTRRHREFLDEIQRNRIPRQIGDWKLLEKSVGLVAHRFIARTGGARLAIFFDEGWESGPVVLPSDCIKCCRLAIMACKGMIVQVLENT